jgi:tripartite-type tricarboxylate transporter receptor subunit TctC
MKRLVLLIAAMALAGSAAAQTNWPTRPLRIIIPWPPGQATDLMARIIAQKMSEQLGQQVIADNRPGAGGMIGTDIAAKATPDGYTLLAASSGPVTINPLLQKVPFDPVRDLAPVANVVLAPFVLVSHPKVPATNAREFIAYVKANSGKLRFASSGTGATAHLIAELFNSRAGLSVIHVPYKGSAPALIDVVAGQVEYAMETAASTMPNIKAGRLRAYGLSMSRPSAIAPGIEPLATAANLPGFDAAAWIGIMVPSGTPRPIVDRLSAAIATAMKAPDTGEKLAVSGLELDYRRPDEFTRYLAEQRARFLEIIKKNNIKIEG